ncbi:flagellar basal body P-ring protein FlgI [Candidatus Latescibacterota bacterium]
MRKTVLFIICVCLVYSAAVAQAQVRLKDIALIKDQREIQLKGLGLITGLDGTGDGKNTQFTIRMIGNMMRNFDIDVPSASIKVKNAAAVMVTATVSPYVKVGGSFDVNASSLGDSKSLEGGTLLMTILTDASGRVYGKAQGPFSIGGANRDYGGGMLENATLAGVVPGGGILERDIPTLGVDTGSLTVTLRNPDYTTAYRIANAINSTFAEEIAVARDAGSVIVSVPDRFIESNGIVRFISEMEIITVETDERARVVINERTGTIVAGGNVSLSPVAIMQGTLALTISEPDSPAIPPPGVNVTGSNGDRMVAFGESANISQLARSLSLLGVTPRDLIAIFQALKAAGSLRAELIII